MDEAKAENDSVGTEMSRRDVLRIPALALVPLATQFGIVHTATAYPTPAAWQTFKLRLAEHSPWLDAFSVSAVAQAIELIKSTPRIEYEPLLLDTYLRDASKALDRCLEFRRQAYDLEIAAVKAAADYALFLDLWPIDSQLETLDLRIPSLQAEQSGYRGAASAYTTDAGFKKHDQTLADRATTDLDAASKRQELLNSRWKIRKQYEAEYNSRHTAPGNAHNFKERLDRMVRLLADDLQEAYEKLVAAHRGLQLIYGKDVPTQFPELQGEGTLDALVMWTRDLIRLLDIEAEQEVTYDLVIPLAQAWRHTGKPIVQAEALWDAIDKQGATKVIRFDLSDVFCNQERVRLRAVGLAFGSQPSESLADLDRYGYWRLRATIHTPKQPKATSRGEYYFRPPIVLGDVAAYGRSIPVAKGFGPECHNVDPRGQWTIVLNKYSVWSDHHGQPIESPQMKRMIADLKLFLTIVSKPMRGGESMFAP